MNKPIITEGIGSITYIWEDLSLKVIADRITDDGNAELRFCHLGDGQEQLLHTTRANLMSTTTMSSLAKRLENNSKDIEWGQILTYVTGKTIEIIRRGEPVVPIGLKPPSMKVEYQLAPILEKDQPTTIYAPGGSCKSYLADYIAVLVQLGIYGISPDKYNCWMPQQGNVLYLDWEASKEDHDRRVWAIKEGFNNDSDETFLYRFCSQPLISDIHAIQKLVFENKIDLVIIDSQMAASGNGTDPAQVASQFYNALRSLKCTTLTIDHVSKEGWRNSDSTGPYGSVVKFNRSRSQFELKKSQTPGDDHVELALVHHKHNGGKLLKPTGIRIDFKETIDHQLEKVTFSYCDIKNNSDLNHVMTSKDRLTDALKRGSMTVKELADELGKTEPAIRTELNRHKDTFIKNGEMWGLVYINN